MAHTYSVSRTTGEYTVTFNKAAVATLVDVVYSVKGRTASISTAKYDNLLREGQLTIRGRLGAFVGKGVSTEDVSTALRVWYVEYADGSVEGDLDPGRIIDEFVVFREAVKRYARRYSELARAGTDAVERALDAEQPATQQDKMAVLQIRVNLRAFPESAALASRLERLAE